MASINVISSAKLFLLCCILFFTTSVGAYFTPSLTVVIYGKTELATKYIDLLKEKTNLDINVTDMYKSKSIKGLSWPFVVVGSKALDAVLEKETTLPIISVLVSRVDFHKSIKSYNNKLANITAVYSDPDLFLQFKLIAELYTSPTVSILMSEASLFMKDDLLTSAKRAGVNLLFTNFSYKTDNIDKTINSIRHSDILLAMPDRDVWNLRTIKNILISSFRQDQAVFGFSRKMVQIGSLATVYSDIENIAEETTKMLLSYEKSGILPTAKSPGTFNIEVNKSVAISFGKTYEKNKLMPILTEGASIEH